MNNKKRPTGEKCSVRSFVANVLKELEKASPVRVPDPTSVLVDGVQIGGPPLGHRMLLHREQRTVTTVTDMKWSMTLLTENGMHIK